jgi:hypothetical protein
MLRRLLQLAAGMDTTDTVALARALDMTPERLRQMLEALQKLGFVEEIVPGCDVPCERCPLRAACLFRLRPRVWILTRRGERALRTRP